ncbi:MAG: hypothetical protein AMXMBFR13_07650 [Phycisphaerae bacterium]
MDALSTVRSKVGWGLAVLLSHVASATLIAQQPLPVSKGVYRLPYADGTDVRFSNDHTNHPTTRNRVDMTGQGGGPFTVVAAAAGWIRVIVENNDTSCPNAQQAQCPDDPTGTGTTNDCNGDGTTTLAENNQAQNIACGGFAGTSTWCCERDFEGNGGTCPGTGTCQNIANNFVWMEHPNGEWTKYTHMQRGSVGPGPDNNGNPGAGRFVGEFVAAGTPLGLEGDVGIASGPHLHFEVAVPEHLERLADIQALNAIQSDPDFPPDAVCNWFGCGCAGPLCPYPPLTCTVACIDGFLRGDGVVDDVDSDGTDDVNRRNRIPVFCGVGIPIAGDENTAGPCNDLCDEPNVSDVSGMTITAGSMPFYSQVSNTLGNPAGDFVVEALAGAALRAGTRVTLSPGFHAEPGSYFSASIGACDTPGGTGE